MLMSVYVPNKSPLLSAGGQRGCQALRRLRGHWTHQKHRNGHPRSRGSISLPGRMYSVQGESISTLKTLTVLQEWLVLR